MLYFPRGRVISKPSVCANGYCNKREFLLFRALIFRKRGTDIVMKRYDFFMLSLKCLLPDAVQICSAR